MNLHFVINDSAAPGITIHISDVFMTRRRYLIILPMVIVIAINAMDRVNFAVWIPALQKDWHCSLAPNGDISLSGAWPMPCLISLGDG
ncbi:hypothetical protein N4G58_11080 [Edwardsiella piscicida]|nr:hypothetical protein N4G58_11080 [Edwardsiella piscicida]